MEGHAAGTVACSDYSTKPQRAKGNLFSKRQETVWFVLDETSEHTCLWYINPQFYKAS